MRENRLQCCSAHAQQFGISEAERGLPESESGLPVGNRC